MYLVANPKSQNKICWHFSVHFGIHAKSIPWHVRKYTGVDAKSENDSESQKKVTGQMSAKMEKKNHIQ